MCGIAGIISLRVEDVSRPQLQKMADALKHRGPDGEGFWRNEAGIVGFAHRRLSIIDLTEAAAQPMHYMQRYTIVYNGEIYNYIELTETLKQKGLTFTSHTDTEVVVAAYACYGKDCLAYFDGMFAFAIWDEQEQLLFCARDRFGEKPFYFASDNNCFVFASEMKSLWAAGIAKQMDDTMLLNYLTLGFTSNPADSGATFYKDIFQLPHAHYIEIHLASSSKNLSFHVSSYWDIDKEKTIEISEAEAVNQFRDLLHTSVTRRLRSDVALGTSLSGGLDSSSIAAFIKCNSKNVGSQQAFSAVFPGFEKDEKYFIEAVSERLQLQTFSVVPTADGLVKDFEQLMYHQEEPFQSASLYAQYKVYELAKQQRVTVLLDGQGADEFLAGYNKYYHWYWQELLIKGSAKAKQEIKSARALGVKPNWGWKNYVAAYLPTFAANRLSGKAALQQEHFAEINKEFLRESRSKPSLYKPVVEKLNDILYFNTMQFGLQDLLRYADRNSMAHSREVRLPFLNHQLVEFIFSLPSTFKIKDGWTKWILRTAVHDLLPEDIVWRKDKVGFEPPQKQWMQEPQLIDFIHESKRTLVHKNVLKKEVLQKPVRAAASHEEGNYDWRYLCAAACL